MSWGAGLQSSNPASWGSTLMCRIRIRVALSEKTTLNRYKPVFWFIVVFQYHRQNRKNVKNHIFHVSLQPMGAPERIRVIFEHWKSTKHIMVFAIPTWFMQKPL